MKALALASAIAAYVTFSNDLVEACTQMVTLATMPAISLPASAVLLCCAVVSVNLLAVIRLR